MKLNPHFKLRSIAGETIIVNQGVPDTDLTRIISFNFSACLLWKRLSERISLYKRQPWCWWRSYHIPQEQAERDVVIWADALKNVQPYLIDITMDIILDKPEQMLFALLRSALNGTKPVSEILFTDISPALWQACYKLACTQE